jgi:hypothetical protein
MQSTHHTTRWLITAGLIVSLGLAGLFPPMAVWAVASTAQQNGCCCGTETGDCCGTACCGMRVPSPNKGAPSTPTNDNRRDGRYGPLAVVIADGMKGSGNHRCGAFSGRQDSDAARPSAESSLQAKHVRLDA